MEALKRRTKIDNDIFILDLQSDTEKPIEKEEVGVLGTAADMGKGVLGGVLDAGEAILDLKDIFNEEAPDTRILPKIETKTGWGSAANTISQIALGLAGAGKFIKVASWAGKGFKAAQGVKQLSKGASVAKGLTQGAIADFTVFDENEERLSDLLVQMPEIKNPVTDYLATQKDDSKAERRLKNVLEGMALGGAAEIILMSARAAKLWRKGDKQKATEAITEAAGKFSDEGIVEAETAIKSSLEKLGDEVIETAEVAKLLKDTPDEALENYNTFKISKTSDRLKATVETISANMAHDVEDIMALGEKDIAAAFSRAIQSNKAYAEFGTGVKDSRLQTVMIEAVRDKVITKTTFADMKMQTEGLINAGFMDEGMAKQLRLDDEVLNTLAPRLLLYRMESGLKAANFANAIGKRVRGDVAGTDNIEALAYEFSSHVAYTQSIISGLGRGLGSLRMKPNKGTIEALLSKSEKTSANVTTSLKNHKTPEAIKIKEGVNALENTPFDKLNIKNYVLDDNKIKTMNSLLSSGLDLNIVEHLRALNALVVEGDNKFTRLFADAGKTGYAGKTFRAIYANNLLSSPATHVFNTLGNTIKLVLSPATRIAGGILTTNSQEIKRGLYQYAAYASVFTDSFKAMAASFKAGGGLIDNIKEYPKIKAQRIGEDFQMQWAKKAIEEGESPINAYNAVPEHIKKLSIAVGYLGSTGQLPLRVMGATDEFFKQMAYRSEVYAKAALDATEKGIADKNEFISKAVKSSLANGKAMDDEALQYAREMTWTQEIKDTGLIGNTAYHLSKIKALQPFVPFITTPTNLFKDIVAHSPFAYGLKDVREAFKAGGKARAMAEGKIAIGQTLCFTAMTLAASDKITGGYPKDPVAKQAWQDMGRLPYSFKIGDKYIPFNRVDPFGAFFGIVADLHDYTTRGGKNADETAVNLVAAIIKNMTSKTYASGLVDAIEILNNPTGGKAAFIAQNIASGMIPFSGALRFTARQLDPEMKEVQTMVDKLKAMTPILSFEQPSRKSWITGKSNEVSYFMSNAKEDRVLEELLASSKDIRAGKPPKILQDVSLSAEQYSTLCELQGTVKIDGKTLYESLEALFNSPNYANAATDTLEDGGSMRSQLTAQLIKRYRKAAISALKKQDKSLLRSIEDEKRRKLGQNKENTPIYDISNL